MCTWFPSGDSVVLCLCVAIENLLKGCKYVPLARYMLISWELSLNVHTIFKIISDIFCVFYYEMIWYDIHFTSQHVSNLYHDILLYTFVPQHNVKHISWYTVIYFYTTTCMLCALYTITCIKSISTYIISNLANSYNMRPISYHIKLAFHLRC